MSSMYSVEGLDLDLQGALAAAVDAARKAGRLIWDAAQKRRAAVAAAYAPASLPNKPADDSDAAAADSTGTASKEPQDQAAAKAISELLRIETKTAANDLVTYYDKRCDALIMSILQQYVDRVNHGSASSGGNPSASVGGQQQQQQQPGESKNFTFRFITEELNPSNPLTDDLTWIVDPIDGTLSFVHGLPDCCVSIGLTYKKECILAVVFCPFLATGTVGVMQASHTKEGLATAAANSSASNHNNSNNAVMFVSKSPSSTPPPPPPLSSRSASKRAIPQPPVPNTAGSAGNTPSTTATPTWEEAGVVECVGELYACIKGRGVFVNGIPVKVNTAAAKKTAMATINFPYGVRFSESEEKEIKSAPTDSDRAARRQAMRKAKMERAIDAVGEIRREMSLDMLPGVRSYGSCVTTLALIASGHMDLYLEPAGKVWDVVCGSLMVTEAGGCVRNMIGEPCNLSKDTTIAAGATEELVGYVTGLVRKHGLAQFYLC